jgi:hypothetical protein
MLFSFLEWRLRRRKGRRKAVTEIICNCGAYSFSHRFGGGSCNGENLVKSCWENRSCGDCKNIVQDLETLAPYCKVVDGGESLEECEMLQDFLQKTRFILKESTGNEPRR